MQLGPPRSQTDSRAFSGTIVATMAGMVAAAIIAAGIGLYLAANGSDAISVERQARSAQHAMNLSIDELALQQETVAIWDDSAQHVTAAKLDQTWIHDNIGSWLHRMFGQDEVIILDRDDRPIYASGEGLPVSVGRYAELSRDLRGLVRSVRGFDGGPNGIHDRNPGRALPPGTTVRTTARATHDSHMLLIGGRPAAASAMLIQPSTPGYVRPNGNWPILLSVRYLDRNFLNELSSRQLIAAPRFSHSPRHGADETAIPLRTETEGVIGYLVWRPEFPGRRIFWKILPLNIAILSALAAFIAVLGRRLRQKGADLTTAEQEAAHLAFHDPLTGLPNRAFFHKRVGQLIPSGRTEIRPFGLVLLDLDDFKLTNDTLGHDTGDALLLAFADRLSNAIRSDDLVARLGGDEFALLLNGIDSRESMEAFAANLLERLRQPCTCNGLTVECRASIGGSLSESGDSAEDLLKRADLALYAAKNAGRGAFRLYESGMRATMLARSNQLSGAKWALEQDLIRPYYQPKVDLGSGVVAGFEALMRWQWEDGTYGPDRILAALEDPTLATRLSDRMIDHVIEDISAWRAASIPFGHVAINAAAPELRLQSFAPTLFGKLAAARVPPCCVQIEVTEGVLLGRGADHVGQTLIDLAAGGIKLAWDDFGTGFASLSHLKQYPVGVVKIDRTFVRDVQFDPANRAIVTALVGLSAALGIDLIAEGIETEAQRETLCALGCAIGQGHLFSKAIPAAEVPGALVANRYLAAA